MCMFFGKDENINEDHHRHRTRESAKAHAV